MPFLHVVIIATSILVTILAVWQWFGGKGTLWHAIRGISLGVSAAALVAMVVALTLKIGLVLTPVLPVHLAIGTVFFYSVFRAVPSGFRAYRNRSPENIAIHRRWARRTMLFLVLAVVSAIAASKYRKALQAQSTPPPAENRSEGGFHFLC